MKNNYLSSFFSDSYSDKWLWGGVKWDIETMKRMENEKALENYGYKVYSQNDEDGIINEIFKRIGTTNKKFIEFGLQDGLESNTHYLLFYGWNGLWIECDEDSYAQINKKFVRVIQSGQLKVLKEFITKDNINELFSKAGFKGEIDLLSIDIDGNDYYVFDEISIVNPRVVIMEFNGKFSPDYEWVMPYNPEHIWDGTDKHGASLKALELLADRKGYQLVGTNINGCNAFFVRKDLTKDLFIEPATAENLFNPMRVNFKHKAGHPSGNCLFNQRAGIEGVFDFYPNENIVFQYGFHAEEKNINSRYRWMSAKEGKCLLKVPVQQAQKINIYYMNALPDNFMAHMVLEITINGHRYPAYQVDTQRGKIQFVLQDEVKAGDILSILFSSNILWSPKEKLNTEDTRLIGVGFEIDTIEFE